MVFRAARDPRERVSAPRALARDLRRAIAATTLTARAERARDVATHQNAAALAPPLDARRYDFVARDLDTDREVALSTFKGKVCLIVNVASK